jgi:O-acetyl-ADP-ribose deacetylase (regulator of RNase III)
VIRVVRGDLAGSAAEAIFREARSDGGPVSPSGRGIVERLGPDGAHLLELDEAPAGSAWLTPAGSLPATFMIHLVVQSPDEPVTTASVRRALVNGLRRAASVGIERVALPPLGVGAGNLEHEQAAAVIVEALADHLEQGEPPRGFEIVVSGEYEEEVFRRAAAAHAPPDEAAEESAD